VIAVCGTRFFVGPSQGKLADSSARFLERRTLGWHPSFRKA
jgi:hypothetical protein